MFNIEAIAAMGQLKDISHRVFPAKITPAQAQIVEEDSQKIEG
jgi:hypothetical protein